MEKQAEAIRQINTRDPELIPLHHLLLKEIGRKLEEFDTAFIPSLRDRCANLDYYAVVSLYDQVAYLYRLKLDTMRGIAGKVDSLFYAQARIQLGAGNRGEVMYLLNRSLQYNPYYLDALILKGEMLFEEGEYEACLEVLQTLFHEVDVDEEYENQLIIFTQRFYEELYETADSLVKIDLASDALRLFKILEQFCANLPSTYCNDDYYHGILRSKKGVYESYLRIAQVAEERGSLEIAEKFTHYAAEYRKENEDEIALSIPEMELPGISRLNIPEGNGAITQVTNVEPTETPPANSPADSTAILLTVSYSPDEILEMETEYQRLFLEAVAQCLEDDFAGAYKTLQRAVELEACACFTIDPRIKILYGSVAPRK